MNTITHNSRPAIANWLQIVILTVATVLVYGHTLDVPFYLDDFSSIVDNPVIYDTETVAELWKYASLRIVGYSTFLANFKLHHFDVVGYHIVNIVFHLLAGISVFFLTKGLLSTPVLQKSEKTDYSGWLPLLVAALFLIHPMQTQGVTYIVQRLTSMTALFYISSLAAYVYGRLSENLFRRFLLIFLAIFFFVLAFFTKQNCVTLPMVIIVLEVTFFPSDTKKTVSVVTGLTLLGILCWLVTAKYLGLKLLPFETIDRMTRETTTITRGQYCITQVNVIWTYIRMFFLPVGLHLDHDIALVSQVTQPRVILGVLGHILLLGSGLAFFRRSPIFAFAIFFYYLTHLVESTIIPIRDLLFEHRAYLPNFGLCLLTGSFLLLFLPKHFNKWIIVILTSALLLGLGTVAWSRNQIWRDPIALWRDSAEAAPGKARPWNELGKHLVSAGRLDEAIIIFTDTATRGAKKEGYKGHELEEEASVNLMMALAQRGKPKMALEVADDFLRRNNARPINRSKMFTNKGNILFQQRQLAEAEQSYRQALNTFPKNITPLNNLGILLMATGRLDEAEQTFIRVLTMDPDFAISREKLQLIRAMKAKKE